MKNRDFQVTSVIRLEGKISAKDRETAEAEAESQIRHQLKTLPPWMHQVDLGITATTRIL